MVLRRYHPLVWAFLVVHLFASLAFSLLTPMFRSPDEAQHIDMLRQYRLELGHDRPDRMVPWGPEVIEADRSVAEAETRPRPPLLTEDATPRPDRIRFSEFVEPGAPSELNNQLTQHPPAYYALVSGVTTFVAGLTPSGWWSWDREVYFYRFLSVLLTAPLPLLAAEAAMATRLSQASGAVAAGVVLLVPQATAVGSSVNNDALVMAGAAVAVVAALHHLRSRRPASAWLAAGAGAVAALTKATAAPVLAWVVIVVVVASWGRWREPSTRSTLVGTAVATAAGAGWYVRNVFVYRDPQPSGFRERDVPLEFSANVGVFLRTWLDRLSQSFWGLPARRTGVALPSPVSHSLTVGTIALALVALADTARRRAVVLLVTLAGAQVLLLAQTNWRAHLRTGVYPAVQGRYLFAILVPLAVLTVIGARQLRWRIPGLRALRVPSTTSIALAVGAVGSALHLLLAWSMLQGFWGPPGASLFERLEATVAWSSLPAPLSNVVLWGFAFAVVGVILAAVTRPIWELQRARRR